MKVTAYKCELCGTLSEEKLTASLSIRYPKEVDLERDVVLEICADCEEGAIEFLHQRGLGRK